MEDQRLQHSGMTAFVFITTTTVGSKIPKQVRELQMLFARRCGLIDVRALLDNPLTPLRGTFPTRGTEKNTSRLAFKKPRALPFLAVRAEVCTPMFSLSCTLSFTHALSVGRTSLPCTSSLFRLSLVHALSLWRVHPQTYAPIKQRPFDKSRPKQAPDLR